jgi:hypothetical protein
MHAVDPVVFENVPLKHGKGTKLPNPGLMWPSGVMLHEVAFH